MITIRNEKDLHDLIVQVAEGEWDFSQELRFEGYPRFEVTLRGERFDGGVPTRIMPPLIELQRTLDKAAAEILGVARLDNETRRRTEIVVRVEDGSTSFVSDLAPVINVLAGKMNGTEAMGVIIALIVTVGGVTAFKYWLNHRRDLANDLKNIDLRLSEEETRRFRIVQEIVDKNPSAAAVAARGDGLLSDFFRKMEPTDEIEIQGNPISDGATVKRLLRKPRAVAIQDRLDGEFLILSVDSGAVRDGVRAKVTALDDSGELTVAIPKGTLTDDQLAQVQNGEWDKKPLRMEINITRVEGRITKATLVKAGLVPMAS